MNRATVRIFRRDASEPVAICATCLQHFAALTQHIHMAQPLAPHEAIVCASCQVVGRAYYTLEQAESRATDAIG